MSAPGFRRCSSRRTALAVLALGALVLCGLLGLWGCSDGEQTADGRTPVRVFAAASLAAAFEDVKTAFEARHPDLELELNFLGTPQLLLQLKEGAVADVFASADHANVAHVVAAKLNHGVPRLFATNKLVIVTPPGNPKGVRSVADLARTDITVALCGPDVPAGAYAREMLKKADVAVESDSDEPSVKAVVTKAQLGEIDAGVVYETDVKAAGAAVAGVAAVAIPEELNVRAEYPIVQLKRGKQRNGGRRFFDFVLGPEGRKVLARHGFGLP